MACPSAFSFHEDYRPLSDVLRYSLSLAHTARFLSLATKILSSVVSDEEEFLACLILKIVVSDKNR